MAKQPEKKSDFHVDRHEEVGGLSYEAQQVLLSQMRDGILKVERVGLEFFPEEDKKEDK